MSTAGSCPTAGKPGKRVRPVTVRSVVRNECTEEIEGRDWFFCDLPECDVVYFSGDGKVFHKKNMKVRVGIKEKESPKPVCYCFGHTVESIREEIARTGRSTVAAAITAKIQAGLCACELRNPQGRCCLGEVNQVVDAAWASRSGESLGGDAGRSRRNFLAGVYRMGRFLCYSFPEGRRGNLSSE